MDNGEHQGKDAIQGKGHPSSAMMRDLIQLVESQNRILQQLQLQFSDGVPTDKKGEPLSKNPEVQGAFEELEPEERRWESLSAFLQRQDMAQGSAEEQKLVRQKARRCFQQLMSQLGSGPNYAWRGDLFHGMIEDCWPKRWSRREADFSRLHLHDSALSGARGTEYVHRSDVDYVGSVWYVL